MIKLNPNERKNFFSDHTFVKKLVEHEYFKGLLLIYKIIIIKKEIPSTAAQLSRVPVECEPC